MIIKLVTVYQWYENLPLELNKIILLPVFKVNKIISFFSGRKKNEHNFFCKFLRKQGYHVTNIARKTKVSSYKCGVEKINSSRLLVQRIDEFKMNEIRLKTPR